MQEVLNEWQGCSFVLGLVSRHSRG